MPAPLGVGCLLSKDGGNNMRWYHTIGSLTFVFLVTIIGLPDASYAQGAGSLMDFRDKSSSSAEDLA